MKKELVTKILLKNLDVGLNVKNINKGYERFNSCQI